MQYENQFKIEIVTKEFGKMSTNEHINPKFNQNENNYYLDNHLTFIHEIEVTVKEYEFFRNFKM